MVTLYNILFTIYCIKDIEKNLQKSQYIFTMMCRPMAMTLFKPFVYHEIYEEQGTYLEIPKHNVINYVTHVIMNMSYETHNYRNINIRLYDVNYLYLMRLKRRVLHSLNSIERHKCICHLNSTFFRGIYI